MRKTKLTKRFRQHLIDLYGPRGHKISRDGWITVRRDIGFNFVPVWCQYGFAHVAARQFGFTEDEVKQLMEDLDVQAQERVCP